VGNIDEYQDQPMVRMRLLRHPDQEGRFEEYPTSLLMMRHVYLTGSTNIDGLEVSIQSREAGKEVPDSPQNLPASTYLHMFGLDELDQANAMNPDGRFDMARSNLWDGWSGFLFLPGLRPFSPPDSVVVGRLIRAGVPPDSALTYREELFGANETVENSLYTLHQNDPLLPVNRYSILVRTSGPETEITSPQDRQQ
jgi:hypothetical protein